MLSIGKIFIFILICFLSNEWSFLPVMLLTEKQSACFNPRCSHSHSYLEAGFQYNSLFWPSVIMMFFTLYSALKMCFLGTDRIYAGEARSSKCLESHDGSSLGILRFLLSCHRKGWLTIIKCKVCMRSNFELVSPLLY